jgi:hypothetical protein
LFSAGWHGKNSTSARVNPSLDWIELFPPKITKEEKKEEKNFLVKWRLSVKRLSKKKNKTRAS